MKDWFRRAATGNVSYEQVNGALVQALPELEEAVNRSLHSASPQVPGPHWLYDEVLNPHITELLDARVINREALERVFGFVERLSASTDRHVREVVTDTILAALEGEPRLTLARRHMGPATRRLLKMVER